MQLPYIPADVPFTGDQKAWLAGFLAGLNTRIAMPTQSGVPAAAAVASADERGIPLQIVFGSQTGTAEWLSEQTETLARTHGFDPVRCDLDSLDITALSAARRLLVITSTYGEGDMPDNAELFWRALAAPDAPRLDGLFYGVLGLGDSIYDGFCQAGKNIDTRLAELGATRVVDRVDCDVDFEEPADAWIRQAVAALAAVDADTPMSGVATPGASEPAVIPKPESSPEPATSPDQASGARRAKPKWTRKNPYPATIVANSLLSAPESDKEVRHLVISLGDSGIAYQPGDGISISPVNDAQLVERIIERLGVSPDVMITDRRTERTLRDTLTHHVEISTPSKYLVDYIAQRSQDAELTHLTSTGDREALDAWLWGKDVLDLLDVDPALTITPEELLAELRPLQHRVYSISSSPVAHAGTVHITMATVRYRSGERQRGGVCSTYLADRRPEGTQVEVFISANKSFRLPADDTKIIMIGPGTGIAPFRSFLHERAARGARGGNWLFFGDRHRDHDHIYAEEIDGFVTDGLLDRLDLAFSRDQEHKIYVQDRMREQGADLFAWLSDGAHLYVCGDATRMAHDVDTALHDIIAEHGGMSAEAAQDHVDDLKRAKRYLRDVY
ncbi:sulfite reductase subunit alpha [Gordonia hankookensis]|uniref:Sulfite reductase subunit alpha n=1 Tax=Gordonia hankookensis TaxID=589403 RepID=A0ABR7WDG6_9ACTN|nr:sulfite reductase subunit alpha [Gordonia hankookensis]MBD1320826.1 sulfite reductase subunit alpha [Gordonia hankookensis]